MRGSSLGTLWLSPQAESCTSLSDAAEVAAAPEVSSIFGPDATQQESQQLQRASEGGGDAAPVSRVAARIAIVPHISTWDLVVLLVCGTGFLGRKVGFQALSCRANFSMQECQ